MTSRDVSIRLTVTKDQTSKDSAKNFRKEIEDALNASKAVGVKVTAADFTPLIKSAKDYKRIQDEIGANAVRAFEDAKEQVIGLAESFDEAREGYAAVDKFVTSQTQKTFDALDAAWKAHLRKQAGLREKADQDAERKAVQVARDGLAKRLELYKQEREERKRTSERAAADYERAQMRQSVATREFREAIANTVGGIQSMTRGLVTMGVLGEKSAEDLTRGLLKVYAIMDTFQGAVTTINHLSRAMTQYKVVTDAAAKSQKALAVVIAGTNAISGASGAAAGAAGAGSAAGGAAVGSAAAGAAAGGVLAGMYGAVKAAVVSYLPTVATVAGRASLLTAAAGGTYLGGRAIANIGNNQVGGFNDTVGGTGWNPFTKAIRFATGDDRRTAASNASMVKAQERRLELEERSTELEQKMVSAMQEQDSIISDRMANEAEILNARLASLTNEQKIAALTKAEARERRAIAEGRRLASQDEFNDGKQYMAIAEKHHAKLKELVVQRADAEKEIAQRKAQSARDALNAARHELDKVTERIKTEQQAYLSAQERFGLLGRDQQQAALSALVKARRGGSLSSDELSSLQSLGTGEAGRLASSQARSRVAGDYTDQIRQLTNINNRIAQAKREMRELDEPITGRDARNRRTIERNRELRRAEIRDEITSLINRERGIEGSIVQDKALRSTLFGDERRQIQQAFREKNRIDANIKTQIQVVANFDRSAQQVAEAVNRQLQQVVQPFVQNVQERLGQLQTQVTSLANQRRNLGTKR